MTRAGEAAGENAWVAACVARADGRLRSDATALAAAVERFDALDARYERARTLLLLPGRADQGAQELAALGLRGGSVVGPAAS